MRNFRTQAWYKKREAINEKIDAHDGLKMAEKWLLQHLVRELLPQYDGGEWEEELHPGIYKRNRFDVAKYCIQHSVDKRTLRGMLGKFEQAGVIERSWDTSDKSNVLLFLSATPLLKRIEAVKFPQNSPKEGGEYKNVPISITYNTVLEDEVSPLIPFLRRRIGNGAIVVKAGWKPGSPKYYEPGTVGQFNFERYLAGDMRYQYASYPLIDGKYTYQIDYDIDDTQAWLDTHHDTIQRQLAFAGYSSIYCERSPGHAHLIVPYTNKVVAYAEYQKHIQAAPALARCHEVYPVADKKGGKISWPFFYTATRANGKKEAVACQLVAYYATDPLKAVYSKGILTDRVKTEEIVRHATNAAPSLGYIPQLPYRMNRYTPTPTNDTERDDFNATHTVPELLGYPVGARIHSLRNDERTPSAKIWTDHFLMDFSGGTVVRMDAYDV
jgi:hypothetical protein